jgi:hypothetical protein
MAKATALVVTFAFLTSCGGPEVWIPQGNSRPAVTREHVQYLDSPPQRPYRVIGIITPPSREYETLAEAVKAIRKEAAKHGADAVQRQSCGNPAPRHPRSLPLPPNPCFQRLKRCLASSDTSLVPSIRKGDTSTYAATRPAVKQKIRGPIRYSSFHKVIPTIESHQGRVVAFDEEPEEGPRPNSGLEGPRGRIYRVSPVIRVYDEAGNVIETHEHARDFKRVVKFSLPPSRKTPHACNQSWRSLNSIGILTFETVPGLNRHFRNALRADLSSIGFPVLCAIEASITLPLLGSTDTTQTPLPVMRRKRTFGYSGRGA